MKDRTKIRFVLLKTSHPGNVGASARALKNMGFSELYLVDPSHYPHPEAVARASGADDILQNAIVVSSLREAIADCHLIFGTSSRDRSLPIPLLTPREFANLTNSSLQSGDKVAVLFGQERTGLTNEELAVCHYHLAIPCNPNYPSLNIAAAVQIIAYELRLSLYGENFHVDIGASDRVSAEDMERFYDHLEKTLISIKFLNPDNPRQMMRKLRRLFNRISLEQNEMNILRGILSALSKQN